MWATFPAWAIQSRASHSEAATAPALCLVQPRLDYLAQHVKQKLVRFLDARSGIAANQKIDIGLANAFNREMIRAIKPIYRTGDKESFGEQYGTQATKVVTVKAKEGYAVGGMTVKHGGGFDGMSVIFMKVVDGKLDPKDTYESDFVGSDEKKTPTKVIGSGNTVIGVVGKINDKDMTGMGLLYKGQVFEPKKKP